ncbi:MAG: putative Co/Zn/Cd cation transporter [Ignavibacteria bacterium]|nr:MAG: putative Co/Zn/Cd cation transporter [Ignavibacteria bacterium]KAF0160441.1 MAG: putative Co/Zn/Cd cation transporter [Ignavibacteria bacterium]
MSAQRANFPNGKFGLINNTDSTVLASTVYCFRFAQMFGNDMTADLQNNLFDKKKAAWISLIVGGFMFCAKITAYLLTDSTAIFSDAAESVVHVAATTMALYSIYLSSKPADENHLYGHGNIEYFSAGVEGLLIIVAAITIIYTSGHALIFGVTTQKLGVGTTIIGIAGIVNLALGLYLVRKGKQTNSLILVADGKHVLTDSYTSLGVVVGLILVLATGFEKLDPIIAILVAVNILFTGYKLIRESIGGLMHETDQETLALLANKINEVKKEYWIDLHHLRFWKSSDRVYIDFHLILPYYFTVKESHLEEEFIERHLESILPNSGVRIHMDYCKENVCKYCGYIECKERLEQRSISFTWDTKRMLGDPVYTVPVETLTPL